MEYIVGVDVGGTFTDIVFINETGEIFTYKLLSTPEDYTKAVFDGIKRVLSDNKISPSDITRIVHGCTVATNAILEHKGARTGLITTKGFRDILEIRRYRMPKLYDISYEKPTPLVSREFRLEVEESIDYTGKILKPLDIEGVRATIELLVSKGVESIAVCFLNSYVNPIHEQQVKQLIEEEYPHLSVSISSELMPLIKEYERTSEAVVNAYIKPVVKKYLILLSEKIQEIGIRVPLRIMQSSGGMMSVEAAVEKPVFIIECGPAAGVVGAAYLAKKAGIPNILTLDMGGTSTKISVMEDYQFARTPSYEVGSPISVASRLVSGGGYTIRVPTIDIAEISAGGGSILSVDAGGFLHVGPESAGADPGPVCYERGGEEPTLCDANVVLGYLNPEYLVGGEVKLNAVKAREVLEEKVAKPMNMSVEEAAHSAYLIANSDMIRAIRAVTIERGRSPSEFVPILYGGAGPIQGVQIASEFGINRVLVAPNSGVFSACGLIFADVEYNFVEAVFHRLDDTVVSIANKAWEGLRRKAVTQIEADRYKWSEVEINRFADCRYAGQSSELIIPVPWDPFTIAHIPLLAEAYNEEHLKTYAHKREDEPVDVINLRLVARIGSKDLLKKDRIVAHYIEAPQKEQRRKAYFGKDYGWIDTPVLRLQDLSSKPQKGPTIIELYDSTCVVLPGYEASLGPLGAIEIAKSEGG